MRSVLLLLALTACAGAEAAAPVVQPGIVAHLDITGGADQVGQVHQPLAQPVTVRTTDAKSAVVSQQLVNFMVTKGGGSVFVGAVLTNDQGEAQNQWTLGDTAGEQELEARAIDDQGQPIVLGKIHAEAQPGPLAVAHFTVHEMQIAEGDAVTLATTGADAYGNVVPGPAPAALDTLGSLAGGRWTASGFGRARFEIPGDTMTVYARPNLTSLSGVYQHGFNVIQYVEAATMSWDSLSPGPGGNANDCSPTREPWDGWAAWGGVDFKAWRADNADSVQLASSYRYFAVCLDLRGADPVWSTTYFYPDDFEGPVTSHRTQLQLLEGSSDSLVFSSGTAINDTLVLRR